MNFDRHNETRPAAMLQVVRACYEYANLRVRDDAGLGMSRSERTRLEALRRLLEGDRVGGQRRHRRLPLVTVATLKTPSGRCTGTVRNISAGGLYVIADVDLPVGTSVQVTLGNTDSGAYSFTTRVVRCRALSSAVGLGLSFGESPLVLRLSRQTLVLNKALA